MSEEKIDLLIAKISALEEALSLKPIKTRKERKPGATKKEPPEPLPFNIDDLFNNFLEENPNLPYKKGVTSKEVLWGISHNDYGQHARREIGQYLKGRGWKYKQGYRNKKRGWFWYMDQNKKQDYDPSQDPELKMKRVSTASIAAEAAQRKAEYSPLPFKPNEQVLAEWITENPIKASEGLTDKEALAIFEGRSVTAKDLRGAVSNTGFVNVVVTALPGSDVKPGRKWVYKPDSNHYLKGLNKDQFKELLEDARYYAEPVDEDLDDLDNDLENDDIW